MYVVCRLLLVLGLSACGLAVLLVGLRFGWIALVLVGILVWVNRARWRGGGFAQCRNPERSCGFT